MIAARLAAVACLVTLSAVGLVPAAVAADRAGLPGFCPDANGVTVIVDFQELGGTTIVRCAPGEQATGLAALKNAGIQITGTQRWGEGFICRIEGRPDPQADACINTPPATAYWSYWYAPNDGSWKYSEWGVLNRKPPLGSFEGWSFSKDKTATTNPPPRVGPRRPPPPAAPPPAAPPPPANQQPQNPPPAGQPPVTQPPVTTGTTVSSTESVPPPSSAPPSGSAAPVSGTTTGGANWTGDIEQVAAQQDSGPPVGMLVGVGIIVLLVVGAGGIAVRRSRAGRGEQQG